MVVINLFNYHSLMKAFITIVFDGRRLNRWDKNKSPRTMVMEEDLKLGGVKKLRKNQKFYLI